MGVSRSINGSPAHAEEQSVEARRMPAAQCRDVGDIAYPPLSDRSERVCITIGCVKTTIE
jgi:hypothetical protein